MMSSIDKYQKTEVTGTPDDLAMHIQKSRRCIYN